MDEVFCKDINELHNWLVKNHTNKKGIWLVYYKGAQRTMSWKDIVEELLCFGWIDSKANKVDELKSKLWIAPRNPKSNWSAINKTYVENLIKTGRMQSAGLEMVKIAKENGKWDALNTVNSLEIPTDLLIELKTYKFAFQNFTNFPPSTKKAILEWILNAKTSDTRTKRIIETAKLADQNIRANQYKR